MKYIGQYRAWRNHQDETLMGEVFEAFHQAYEAGDTVLNLALYPEWREKIPDHHEWKREGDILWLNRIYLAEKRLAQHFLTRLNRHELSEQPDLSGLNPEQQSAFLAGLSQDFTIINGGPGTGKTYTLGRLVAYLIQNQPNLRLALCAPTGKASQRMAESLNRASGLNYEALTIHRLIGYANGQTLHHRDNPLPFDVVMVDEVSMLSLDLAIRLLDAIAPKTKLIFLGDAQQLSAVEAGAVLSDLIHHPKVQPFVRTLKESKRFSADSGIGRLATALQNQEDLIALLPKTNIQWTKQPTYEALFQPYLPYLNALNSADPEALLKLFDDYRVLTATHQGYFGTQMLNQELGRLHAQHLNLPTRDYFHGLPLMVSANDYSRNLFNGDIGLCLEQNGELWVKFPQRDLMLLSELNPHHLVRAYALTVHKSQGSEYGTVALVLQDNPLLSKELFYTGITRAQQTLHLYANESALKSASQRTVARHTGLFQEV